MNAQGFAFEITARDGLARSARLVTPHGVVETPGFMPVATFGAVRGVAPDELEKLGAQILLSNAYHLHERPGEEVVARAGGLHRFTGWRGPWLTDSGGFQITSLAPRVRIDEDGVTFRSPHDGRSRTLTPEKAVEVQEKLGADVAMVLDECVSDDAATPTLRARAATERTLRWAERSIRARRRVDQALFGIVQGGCSSALRRASARATGALGFDGHGHGGLGLGEESGQREELIAVAHAELPENRPRYLMGLGRPTDLIRAIALGVDLFDCVIPTRNGRHGLLFTRSGTLAVRNASYRNDSLPPEESCDCPTCSRYSRGYLRHLLHVNEALGARLASIHNLRFYLRLLEEVRAAIHGRTFKDLRASVLDSLGGAP
ncbi:MAG TPA: tRNA guanosine(34) transglycosylase Tgt [Myxococcota bacterium]|nr:tRNA guanosine(34) transglycosylase Tgt [Myxococcota bacterium]